jgi:PfpI family intracellular protease
MTRFGYTLMTEQSGPKDLVRYAISAEHRGFDFEVISDRSDRSRSKVSDVSVDEFDALVLPGGTVNPDKLRVDSSAVTFVREFMNSGKPVAAICHGPLTLVEAGVVAGRTLTSYPSIRTDLRNAGARVVDQEVVVDGNLVTSRSPADLPAFCAGIVAQLEQAPARRPTTSLPKSVLRWSFVGMSLLMSVIATAITTLEG